MENTRGMSRAGAAAQAPFEYTFPKKGRLMGLDLHVLVPKGPGKMEAVRLRQFLKGKSVAEVKERVRQLQVGELPVFKMFKKGGKTIVQAGEKAAQMLENMEIVGLDTRNITIQKLSKDEYQEMIGIISRAFDDIEADQEAAAESRALELRADGQERKIYPAPVGKKEIGKKQEELQKLLAQVEAGAKDAIQDTAREFDRKVREYAKERDEQYVEEQLEIRKDEGNL